MQGINTLIKAIDSVGDPPLPIPNREVKPDSADGTAKICGRVGHRHFYRKRALVNTKARFFYVKSERGKRKGEGILKRKGWRWKRKCRDTARRVCPNFKMAKWILKTRKGRKKVSKVFMSTRRRMGWNLFTIQSPSASLVPLGQDGQSFVVLMLRL